MTTMLDAVSLLREDVAALSRHTAEIQSSQRAILARLDTIDAGQAGVTDLLPVLEANLAQLISDRRTTQEGLSNLTPILEAILGMSVRGHEGIETLRKDIRDVAERSDAGTIVDVVEALEALSTRQQEDGEAAREAFSGILGLASQLVEGARADRKQNQETFKQIGETAAFAHSAALGHREPLPSNVADYAVLERFIIAQPADLTSNERALVDWRNIAKDLGTAELVDILRSQYRPSPTDNPETRVLRYRLAAITRATIKGRGAELPPAPSSTRAFDRSAVACMIRSSELAQLWRAGDSPELYAEPELAVALDLFVLAEHRVGSTPNDQQSAELVALHKELATKIETGNRPTRAGGWSPRAAERTISAESEIGR